MNNTSTTIKIFNNTLYQLIGKLVSMSITVLATILVSRYYGREGYGEFSLMQNIPGLFFIVVDFGFNAISTRELAKDFSNAERYFGNILIVRVVTSLFLMGIVAFSLSFFPYSESLKMGLYLSLFLVLTQALYTTTNVIFQAKLRYDLSVIGYVIGSLVILGLVLYTTNSGLDVMWVNASYIVGGFVTFLVNLILLARIIDLRQSLTIDKSLIWYLTVQSLHLGLMFVFSQINFKADSIILSLAKLPDSQGLNNTEAVAIYSLPYKVFEVALVVPTFLMNAVYPIFVRHLAESNERFKQTFMKTTLALFLLGILSTIFGVILAPFMVTVLGGQEFLESVTVLRVLLLGLPIFYITQPISWLLVTLENQKVLPAIYLASAVFNLVGNVLLIPKYSFYASATITWVSELIILALLIYYAKRTWVKRYA